MAAIRGLAEVVILVRDLERSAAFYRDTLGLRVISPPEVKAARFLQLGEDTRGVPQQIVLVQRPADAADPPTDRNQRALHHIGIELDPAAYEDERQRLAGLGFEIRTGQHPFLPVEAFYLDDPDGNEVELVRRVEAG
jgi:catechol 2,3-dioxygenase-like lactoylglutathione lyase family enzyme